MANPFQPLPCLDGPTEPGHARRTCKRCINFWQRQRNKWNYDPLARRKRWKRDRLAALIKPDVPLVVWTEGI